MIDYADDENPMHIFLILKDVHLYLDEKSSFYNPRCVALLKDIAQKTMFANNTYVTVFIVSPVLVLPKEIEKIITVFDIPYPDTEAVAGIIDDYVQSFNISIEEQDRNELIVSFKGLAELEIRQILNYAYQQSGTFDKASVKLVLKEKEQIIRKAGTLEIFTSTTKREKFNGKSNCCYVQSAAFAAGYRKAYGKVRRRKRT